ncbi:hypothetical protein EVG20_g3126 [Dentipellis fragilis]|uniref:Uncharacterized protein n=1 Tax=Dentipellis fragilis TaxID=205917 RepID=A0A4Y9Z6P9_9AGAM|nr:hypothetical protein EVG20_g3126 [Dentipellis fragilis]
MPKMQPPPPLPPLFGVSSSQQSAPASPQSAPQSAPPTGSAKGQRHVAELASARTVQEVALLDAKLAEAGSEAVERESEDGAQKRHGGFGVRGELLCQSRRRGNPDCWNGQERQQEQIAIRYGYGRLCARVPSLQELPDNSAPASCISLPAQSSPAAPSPEVLQKLGIAKQKKDVGDQAFKAGNLKEALMGYHQVSQSIATIWQGLMPFAKVSAISTGHRQVDEMIEKIYANMSACHIKQENWKRAQETAEKALAKNPDNFKALFRKGKALGEQGFFERAEAILEDVARKNPADAAGVNAELSRLRAIDKERERVHNQKLKGWLNRESKKPAKATADETAAA